MGGRVEWGAAWAVHDHSEIFQRLISDGTYQSIREVVRADWEQDFAVLRVATRKMN